MQITKLEAARRQLDCAIHLYFDDDDLCSIITLSRASFRLIWDLYPTIARDSFEKSLSKIIDVLGWKQFNEITNLLKHADKDPHELIEPDEVHAQTGISLSIILYSRATGSYSPAMKAWEIIMTLAQPEIWDAHPDPDHESYSDFLKSVEYYKNASRDERLAMGRYYLRGFKRIEQGLRADGVKLTQSSWRDHFRRHQ